MGSIAGSIAGGLASTAASKLFGGSGKGKLPSGVTGPLQQPAFVPFNTTGLGARIDDSGLLQIEAPTRRQFNELTASQFLNAANQVGGLRPQVAPGFGRLTQARVNAVQNARRRAIGNLADNLARRRISGSSFGADALSRAEAEFGQQEAEVRARSFLEELDATTRLITQESEYRINYAQQLLSGLDFETNVALQLSQGLTNSMSANAQLQANLAAQAAQGAGQFAGQAFGGVGKAVGGFVTDKLGGLWDPSAPNPLSGSYISSGSFT